MFSKRKLTGLALALLLVLITACGGSSGSSSSTESGRSSSTSTLTLSDSGGTLVVPAASFTTDLDITLTHSGVDTSDIGSVAVISTPVALTFSDAEAVTGTSAVTLTLNINAGEYANAIAAGNAVYAKIKLGSPDMGSEDSGDGTAQWMTVLGSINTTTNTLTINFYASAGTIYAAVVAGNELMAATTATADADLVASGTASSKTAQGDVSESTGVSIATGSKRWIIICEKQYLSDSGLTTCNGEDVSSLVSALESDLNDYSTELAALGFSHLVIELMTPAEILSANLETTIPTDC